MVIDETAEDALRGAALLVRLLERTLPQPGPTDTPEQKLAYTDAHRVLLLSRGTRDALLDSVLASSWRIEL